MNAREIFLRVLSFAHSERTINWEFGYWGGALRRWYGEGLKENASPPPGTVYGDVIAGPGLQWPETSYDDRLFLDRDVADTFGFDKGFTYLRVNQWICPRFPEKVLSETPDTATVAGGTASPVRCSRIRGPCRFSSTGPSRTKGIGTGSWMSG